MVEQRVVSDIAQEQCPPGGDEVERAPQNTEQILDRREVLDHGVQDDYVEMPSGQVGELVGRSLQQADAVETAGRYGGLRGSKGRGGEVRADVLVARRRDA